ncbi:ankyrin repeat domain-containing protein [Aspergillus melleus]|uniref:ankyrin repeat domain-containing protein n=1 Tax=Aspergillus melleus TaxID=138277 RepID=UPI001E8CB20F|nr:uncharacterized protein LDX57_003304 [Aspergillus melleus]KAH8425553.1 hypothetical protein LDX57_003304 [Aspergillus melleus]
MEKRGPAGATFTNEKTLVLNQGGAQTFHGPVVVNISSSPMSSTSAPTRDDANDLLRSLAFAEMHETHHSIRRPHRGTCEWIIEQDVFQSWKKQTRGVLWIKGKPGSGKPILMAFLWDRPQHTPREERVILNFFFNARGQALQRTPLGMLRSLLAQLCREDSYVCDMMRQVYLQKGSAVGARKQNWEWKQPELERYFREAIVASAQRKPVTIIVDALDEAGEKSASELVTYFNQLEEELAAVDAKAKFCISSCHYPVLSDSPGLEIHMEAHNGHDIALFINDRLGWKSFVDHNYPKDQDAWQNLALNLTEMAHGVFLWVDLIVPLVKKRVRDGQCLEEVYLWLGQAPRELADTYGYILESVIDESYLVDSLVLFQWVFLAEQPLSVTELRYAMASSRAVFTPQGSIGNEPCRLVKDNRLMASKINAWSGGLLEIIPGDQDFVRPIHQTVKDFVMTQGLDQLAARAVPRSAIERSHDLQPEHHLTLYRSCLNYLVTEVGQIRLERYEREELLEEIPLIEYSANNLFYHAEKAMADQSTNLEDETKALQKMMDQWLSIHQKIYGNSWVYTRPGSTLLHEASAANLVKMVEGLISRGAQVSTKDDKGDTALHYAAIGGHEGVAGVLSRAGADLRARNKYNETPLTYAAQHGQVRFIKWLLLEGVNLGEALPDEAAPSALMEAARWGHDQVVKLLLSSGAMTKVQRDSALLEAVRRQKYEVVKSLLKDGVEANPTTIEEYQSPLQAAIELSSDEIVRILFQHGADPSRCDRYDRNALHLMAECGKFHLVERLKRVDILINEKDCFGKSPIHGAIHYKHLDMAELLFRRGADPHTLDGYGRSSVDWLRADPQNQPDIFKEICSSHAPTPQEIQASALKQSKIWTGLS